MNRFGDRSANEKAEAEWSWATGERKENTNEPWVECIN
jgi:hypothetical protein